MVTTPWEEGHGAKENTAPPATSGTTTCCWASSTRTASGQWYIRDPNTDAPLLTLIHGKAHYSELDWRGMPIRLLDPQGKRVWQGNTDAWGRCEPEMPEGPIYQPILLPGRFADELSGLYNNRFRDYDPKTGRYLTPDPLGIKGGLNSYRYTLNPIDYEHV